MSEDESSARNHLARGEALSAIGRTSEAIGEYQRALARQPDHVGSLVSLASALSSDSQHDEALRHGKRAVSLAPEDAGVHASLARLQLAAGRDNAEMLGAARRCVELRPDRGEFWYLLVLCAIATRDLGTARDAESRCAGTGDMHWALIAKGQLALAEAARLWGGPRRDKLRLAQESFERLLAVNPDDGFLHEQAAEVHRLSSAPRDVLGLFSDRSEEVRHLKAAGRAGRHHIRDRLLLLIVPETPVDLILRVAFAAAFWCAMGAGLTVLLATPVAVAVAVAILPPVLIIRHQDRPLLRRQQEAPPQLKLSTRTLTTHPAILLTSVAAGLFAAVALTWPLSDRPPPGSAAGELSEHFEIIPATPSSVILPATPSSVIFPATPSSVNRIPGQPDQVIPGRPAIVIPGRPAIVIRGQPEIFIPRPEVRRIDDPPDPLETWRVERYATYYAAALALMSAAGAGVYAARRWRVRAEGGALEAHAIGARSP